MMHRAQKSLVDIIPDLPHCVEYVSLAIQAIINNHQFKGLKISHGRDAFDHKRKWHLWSTINQNTQNYNLMSKQHSKSFVRYNMYYNIKMDIKNLKYFKINILQKKYLYPWNLNWIIWWIIQQNV